MYVEFSIYGGQMIPNRAGAQEHRTCDIGRTLAGYKSSQYLSLAGRELTALGEPGECRQSIQDRHGLH